jgi:hypothetical protein
VPSDRKSAPKKDSATTWTVHWRGTRFSGSSSKFLSGTGTDGVTVAVAEESELVLRLWLSDAKHLLLTGSSHTRTGAYQCSATYGDTRLHGAACKGTGGAAAVHIGLCFGSTKSNALFAKSDGSAAAPRGVVRPHWVANRTERSTTGGASLRIPPWYWYSSSNGVCPCLKC